MVGTGAGKVRGGGGRTNLSMCWKTSLNESEDCGKFCGNSIEAAAGVGRSGWGRSDLRVSPKTALDESEDCGKLCVSLDYCNAIMSENIVTQGKRRMVAHLDP
jgi:hypothetical protein